MNRLSGEEKMKQHIFERAGYVMILATIAMFLWGSAFPGVKIGYALFHIGDDVYSKILFAGIRFTAAGILTAICAAFLLKKIPIPKKSAIKGIVMLGLIQTGMQYFFFYIGLSNTTGAKGSILGSAGAFFAVILSHFYYKDDKLSLKKIVGCIIGFGGVILINLGSSEVGSSFSLTGEGFMIIAALAFGASALISKQVALKEDSVVITGYQLFLGGVVLTAIGLFGGGTLPVITVKGILVLCYLVLLSATAFTLWTVLLKYNNVSKMGVYNFLIPVFGVLLSAIFLGENPWSIQIIGALAMVCTGIFIVNFSKK